MRTALALASVVSMRLCRISDDAMFDSIAFAVACLAAQVVEILIVSHN